jgi:hypothetical protein
MCIICSTAVHSLLLCTSHSNKLACWYPADLCERGAWSWVMWPPSSLHCPGHPPHRTALQVDLCTHAVYLSCSVQNSCCICTAVAHMHWTLPCQSCCCSAPFTHPHCVAAAGMRAVFDDGKAAVTVLAFAKVRAGCATAHCSCCANMQQAHSDPVGLRLTASLLI